MEPALLAHTTLLILMWFGTWAFFFFYLFSRGINYIDHHEVTTLYFLFVIITVIGLFGNRLALFVADYDKLPFGILAAAFLLNIAIYYYTPLFLRRPTTLIRKNPSAFFLTFDYRYLISKTFDILYQQIFVILLVAALDRMGFTIPQIIGAFALLFGLIHVPLVFVEGRFWGLYHTTAALLSAIVFPPLILMVPYGFIYTFIIHWGFYTLSGLLFWLVAPLLKKMPGVRQHKT